MDLLARGYAVEIVSPDRVPDNIADLELRLDASPGDRLIAKVEAHDGERSVSLEFLHHLRSPMVDFKRRPAEPIETVPSRELPVRSNAEPGIEDAGLGADPAQPAVQEDCSTAEIPFHREPDLNPEDAARLIVPQVPRVPPPIEPLSHFGVEDTATTQARFVPPAIVPLGKATQRRNRSTGWRRKAALTFAGAVLLTLALRLGMRRTGEGPAQSSGKGSGIGSGILNTKKVATPADVTSSVTDFETGTGSPAPVSDSAVPPAALSSGVSSGPAPKEVQGAKVAGPVANPEAEVSRQDGNDLIAPNTVIYLDKRFEPVLKAKQATPLARQHPKPRTHSGGVVSANSVTYLNKPTPQGGK
jgi:hypothetical protein